MYIVTQNVYNKNEPEIYMAEEINWNSDVWKIKNTCITVPKSEAKSAYKVEDLCDIFIVLNTKENSAEEKYVTYKNFEDFKKAWKKDELNECHEYYGGVFYSKGIKWIGHMHLTGEFKPIFEIDPVKLMKDFGWDIGKDKSKSATVTIEVNKELK